MKWFLVFWGGPIFFLGSWYWLSYYDMSFGVFMYTRQVHDLTFRTPCGERFVLGTIGHDDLDLVIVGMNISLHSALPAVPWGPFAAIALGEPIH